MCHCSVWLKDIGVLMNKDKKLREELPFQYIDRDGNGRKFLLILPK